MNKIDIKPNGYEIIKINNISYTLGQILNLKKQVKKIVNCSLSIVSNNIINNNNFIDYIIIDEYYNYNDIIQPINLVKFFTFFLNLIGKFKKNKILSNHQFNNFIKCKYKNINKKLYNPYDYTKINSKCLICYEEFKDSDLNVLLPCSHNFHKKCIKYWLTKKSNKCPICTFILSRF